MYSSSGLSTDVFFPNKTNINRSIYLKSKRHWARTIDIVILDGLCAFSGNRWCRWSRWWLVTLWNRLLFIVTKFLNMSFNVKAKKRKAAEKTGTTKQGSVTFNFVCGLTRFALGYKLPCVLVQLKAKMASPIEFRLVYFCSALLTPWHIIHGLFPSHLVTPRNLLPRPH